MDVCVSQPVGDFPGRELRGSQQLCGLIYPHLNLVVQRRATGHLFETSAKGRVAHSITPRQTWPIYSLRCPRQDLKPGAFQFRPARRLRLTGATAVQQRDHFEQSNREERPNTALGGSRHAGGKFGHRSRQLSRCGRTDHRVAGREKISHQVSGILTGKSNPRLGPTRHRRGPVAMPFSGKKNHRLTGSDRAATAAARLYHPMACTDPDDLKLVQNPPGLPAKMITLRVSRRWIRRLGRNDRAARIEQKDSPNFVLRLLRQIAKLRSGGKGRISHVSKKCIPRSREVHSQNAETLIG